MKRKIKFRKGLERILASGIIFFGGLVGITSASEILAKNYTPASGFGKGMMYNKTFADANEGFDYHDGSFNPLPDENELEISSNEPGFKARINAKYFNTPVSDLDLSVRNSFIGTIDNSLKLMVTDASGLEYRDVIAYDVNDPYTVYDVNKTPWVITEIELPPLVDPPAGQYAWWVVSTPPIIPGDIASAEGVGKLDGIVDEYDIGVTSSNWLTQTFEGQNYSWADLNYDRIDNFLDFAIQASNWLDGY